MKINPSINMIKPYLIAMLLLFSFIPINGQVKQRPNVIIIYTDDQGAGDMGAYGATDLHTPNMDRLATEGIRFTQSYVAAPVCAPSRAALLTGKNPQNAGVPGNTSAAIGSHGIRDEQYTMAELFKDNGYKTALVGKWHLGMSEESSPNNQGFEYSFGHLRGCIDNYSHYFYWEGPNIHDLHENGKEIFLDGQYFPDLASDRALQYVENNKEDPFFMFYAINMPHYPYQPTEKWRTFYEDQEFPRALYGAFISTIDERIGFLIDKLEELGIRDNTIIIYQSDNGYSTEQRAFFGGGSSGPYRGAKSSLFEGGIRLPTMISWPAALPENEVNDEFIINYDWMPTLAKLCGLEGLPDSLDGLDQSAVLMEADKHSERQSAIWKYGNQWVVRKGPWKLIGFPKDTSHKGILDLTDDVLFLVNLDEDISEMTNLADKHPEIVQELIAMYLAWEHAKIEDIPKRTARIEHMGLSASIKSTGKLHNKYTNIEVLLDGKKGYNDFSTGQWIGSLGNDLEFLIDLKTVKNITEVELSYLVSPGNWIYPVRQIDISYSADGQSFTKPVSKNAAKFSGELLTEQLSVVLPAKQESRFVKIRIKGLGNIPEENPGSGSRAWIFIDEIQIK